MALNIYSDFKNKSILNSIGFICCILVFIGGCSKQERNQKYHQGEPIILKKEYSLIPGVCMYTYEGYGRIETFEDKCIKYSVGDKLGGNMQAIEQDSIDIIKE
jgi:hypothetical protein